MFIDYLLEYNRYCNIAGIFIILGIAYFFSFHKSRINYRLVINGLLLQFLIGFVVLKTAWGHTILNGIAEGVTSLYRFADVGTRFIFGNLADSGGPWGVVFAFQILPIIIFFGAFMALLFHFGVVQRVVLVVSYVVRPVLGTSGAETLCAIANSFLGQTEAPLLIRHYLKTMTKSEMLVVMVSGMGSISGAILVVFAQMGVPVVHLLTASMMAIPSSIIIAKIIYPETERSETQKGVDVELKPQTADVFDAIAGGTLDGLQLALNVAAMLISFLALLAMLNAILYFAIGMTLTDIFAYIFSPFGYLFGFSDHEARAAGELIGIKVSVNELVAYKQMVGMALSERTQAIITYALCGFSNFSCIGIQVGGIGALVPERRTWLTQLGLYAVLGGTLSNLLSAMIASLLL